MPRIQLQPARQPDSFLPSLPCKAVQGIRRRAGCEMGIVDDLGCQVRIAIRELFGTQVAYRSLTGATGVPLVGVQDVVSSSIEIADLFSLAKPALVWIENG